MDSDWNEPALQAVFCPGLNGQVWDALFLGVRLRDLNALINHAIKVDNHLSEQHRERVTSPTTPSVIATPFPAASPVPGTLVGD